MASELSSNWKKLQAQIKAESTRPKASPSSAKASTKRKPDAELDEEVDRVFGDSPAKRQKVAARGANSTTLKPSVPKKHSHRLIKDGAKGTTPRKPQMGNAQSSQPQDVPKATITPSLALWAEDNGISSEALAEAYGLGIRDTSMIKDVSSVRPNEGRAPDVELGKYLAIDCEMVGVGDGGTESALARVSVVDFHGRQVYDSYVRPRERVTDWRTRVSGIAPRHMHGARGFEEVQSEVAELMRGRILVGHDVRHDLQALLLEHPARLIRDTARFSGFRKYGHGPKPALRVLAREILDVEIQTGQHSSIEDARVAMLLFRRHKPAFDVEHANKFGEERGEQKAKGPRKTTKKKRRN
ncbi:RNA exonuclease 4 [Coniochaeta hoffmannii]|uniref:RNA exonuclease 4 n=1 Tax=Coniochaeta hoffmannii TaxID=91930 RepID=A0AA38S1X6_9PEZI|nr:RNA exonuclease 4 [Coniochaeta hoffmannii]